MLRVTASELRGDFSEVVNRVAYGGERVMIERRGKDVAAVISVDDLRLLERLIEVEEDRLGLEESRKILSDPDEERVPWREVRGS